MNDYTKVSRRPAAAARAATYDTDLQAYPQGDYLNSDARAVIEAEFEEIATGRQARSLTRMMKDAWQWIQRRLQRP